MPLLIFENHPESRSVYEERLHHGHPMYVPVQSCALIEASVCLGAYELRESWGEDMEDEVVSQEAEQDLVNMVGKCDQA